MQAIQRLTTLVDFLNRSDRRFAEPQYMNICVYGWEWVVNARSLLASPPPIRDLLRRSACREQLFSVAAKWLRLISCLLATLGCSGSNAGRGAGRSFPAVAAQVPQSHFLLDANPARINMGAVNQGGRKQATFTSTNSGTRTIELARIETSYPCLTVDVPLRISPGEQVVGRIQLDLRDEPDATGDIAVEIKGWTSAGEAAFLVVAAFRVSHKNEWRCDEGFTGEALVALFCRFEFDILAVRSPFGRYSRLHLLWPDCSCDCVGVASWKRHRCRAVRRRNYMLRRRCDAGEQIDSKRADT